MSDTELLKCTRCASTIQPWPVPMELGYGQERIMIVGEAPGREEAESRQPFIGAAGKVLNSLLSNNGLSRSEFFVTNIVRCRPPNNRTPLDEEIANCKSWMDREIERVKPTLLIALGDTAATALTGFGLGWRGSIMASHYGIPCLITYHPAFVMRSRTDYPVLLNDLAKIKNRPKTFTPEYRYDPPVEVARAMVNKWVKEKQAIACDLETAGIQGEGLNPFTDNIIGFAMCGKPGEAFSYTLRGFDAGEERFKLLKEVAENHPIIWQNNIFDRTFLMAKGVNCLPPVWDTMDAMYVIHSDSEKSLDFLRSVYTTIPPYKRVYKKRSSGVAHLSDVDLAHYNCLDVDVTKQVALAQVNHLSIDQSLLLERIILLDTQAIKMRLRGVPVSKDAIGRNYLMLQPEVERLEREFYDKWQVNPNSPKQLAALLYDEMKMPLPPKRRNKTERSTDEEAIKQLREGAMVEDDIQLLDHLLEYRESSKILSTFVQGWFERIGPDGRIHPDWVPTGTDTGRWSCRNPNMQNPPQRIRNQVCAEEGNVLISADFRNLEFLIMLILAKDFETAEAILAGRDVHNELQEEMAKVSSIPPTRLQTKAMVFGTAYGLTPSAAARRFKVPQYVAKGWQDFCFQKFPKLVALSLHHREVYREKGYATSFFGRRKYCEMETQALNHPIQSTGADITHNACLRLEEKGFNPIINIHDEIVCEIGAPSDEETTLREFSSIMEEACTQLYHRFPVKARISKTWQKEE